MTSLIPKPAPMPQALPSASEEDYGYGTRPDGTQKGKGYFGELKRPDGAVSTELTVGVKFDGKEREIPLLVPTLSKKEVDTVLSLDPSARIPEGIIDKAISHARRRIRSGKSPYAASGEMLAPPTE